MKMKWNEVTSFSKILALILFIALPFVGFWFGIQYGEALQAVQNFGAGGGTAPTSAASGTAAANYGYYENVAAWQTDKNAVSFAISYPIDFNYQDNYVHNPVTDWRTGAAPGETGVTMFTLTIPGTLLPQTNFADAKLTVGYGVNAAATADCLKPDASGGPATATTTAMLGGVPFTVFHSTGAGAGNYYETTSYRTLYGGKCWAVEYTVHSTQIGNYPPSYGLTPFDDAYVTGLLDRIVGTFQFSG
jgi:hypothetical protein